MILAFVKKGEARIGTHIFFCIENLCEAQDVSSVGLIILVHCKFRGNPFVMYNFMFSSVISLLNYIHVDVNKFRVLTAQE
jgi:hypothetical protein